jgi:beta-mannosidase
MKRILIYCQILAAIFLGWSCDTKTTQLPVNTELSANWEFKEVGKETWLPAIVPGTVHTDLMANGVIEDPHYALNETDVQWIEEKDWEYKTNFDVEPSVLNKQTIELHFKGLDTYADVFLNDSLILEVDNMFIEHRTAVKGILIEGANELRIYFHSPVKEGLKRLQSINYLIPAINEQAPVEERTNIFTRKAPFHYGWDWGPRLVTSGIWRPAILKAWDNAIIEDVYVETKSINDSLAKVSARVEVMAATAGKYNIALDINGEPSGVSKSADLKVGQNFVDMTVDVTNPRLWWSNGLGDAYLYKFGFQLTEKNSIRDRHELAVGIRTIRLVQDEDSIGRSFYFELNGVPVFMKGANVIPSETLTPMVSEENYRNLIQNTVDGNMNMLRVWGGAIYEEDFFYQLCDENGILVWQDFMFACALQPGDEAHLENIRKEANYNVKRLRNHASIALWCGNNENLSGWHNWGWKEMYPPEIRDFMWQTYVRIFDKILPDAVQEFDPKTAYWSSSPMAYNNELADRKSGDEHDWTIWFGRKPFSAFGENVPRFVSEYGLQAFPGMHTIGSFSEEVDQSFDSKVMRHRQRSKMEYIKPGFDGNDMIKTYMEMYYKVPEAFEDFVYVSQLLQAYAYKTAIEAHRRAMPHCMGSLYWQLNDSWPTISWASVDYYGRWKAAHYAVRDANKEIIISPVMNDGVFKLYTVSDRLTPVDARMQISLMNLKGAKLFSIDTATVIPANTSTVAFNEDIKSIISLVDAQDMVVHMALKEGDQVIAENLFYFSEPKDLKLPVANIELNLEKCADGYNIEIKSDVLAKNVFLNTPYGDVFFSDNYFDLLPGQKKLINITTDKIIEIEDVKILSLNNLLHNDSKTYAK